MREIFALGFVRRLELGTFSRLIDTPHGRIAVSTTSAYRAWVKALHLVVEMQNALSNDHLLQKSVTTGGDPVWPRSHYKIDRAIETHVRFRASYVDVLAL